MIMKTNRPVTYKFQDEYLYLNVKSINHLIHQFKSMQLLFFLAAATIRDKKKTPNMMMMMINLGSSAFYIRPFSRSTSSYESKQASKQCHSKWLICYLVLLQIIFYFYFFACPRVCVCFYVSTTHTHTHTRCLSLVSSLLFMIIFEI